MGLDMYAFITRTPVSPVDFKAPEDSQEIAYWCKHPDLHGWMAGRYFEKGGNDPRFNCRSMRVPADDIQRSCTASSRKDFDNLNFQL